MKQNIDSIPRRLDHDLPIVNYQNFAVNWCKAVALEYMSAVWYLQSKHLVKSERSKYEGTCQQCEQFFRSELFNILMPEINGKMLIEMLKKKAMTEKQPRRLAER